MGDIVSQSHAQELPSITCLGFDRARKPGVLKGWATLHLPRHKLKLYGCGCFASDAGDWILPPSREIGKDADGKPRWASVLEFDSRELQNAFSRAAVRAIDVYTGGSWREGGS